MSHFALTFQQPFRPHNTAKRLICLGFWYPKQSRNGLEMSYETNPLSSLLQYHMHRYARLSINQYWWSFVSSSVYTRRSLRLVLGGTVPAGRGRHYRQKVFQGGNWGLLYWLLVLDTWRLKHLYQVFPGCWEKMKGLLPPSLNPSHPFWERPYRVIGVSWLDT